MPDQVYPGNIPPFSPPPDWASLNPGIKRLVALLRAHGFNTCDSGDGKTHDFECDRPEAYVSMTVSCERLVDEADRLLRVLRKHGIGVGTMNVFGGVMIQASYDPTDGSGILDLTGLTDEMLPHA